MGLSLLGKTKPFCFGTGTPLRTSIKNVPGFVPPSSERSGCSHRVRGWHYCHHPPLRTHRAIFTAVGSSLSNALFGGRGTATEAVCDNSSSVQLHMTDRMHHNQIGHLRWSRFFGQQCCLEYKRHDYEKGIIEIKAEYGTPDSSPTQIR